MFIKQTNNLKALCNLVEVRYQLDEDPKTLKVFPIPLCDSGGNPLHYDRLSLCPEGKILATSHGSTLQWLCAETGNVLDTAEKAHEGDRLSNLSEKPQKLKLY